MEIYPKGPAVLVSGIFKKQNNLTHLKKINQMK